MLDRQNTDTYKNRDNKASAKVAQNPARMPKEQARSLAQKLKMATMVVSIILFGFFGGLIAPELQKTTATTQTKSSSSTGSQSTAVSTPTSSSSSSSQSSSASSQQQNGGYSFGNSNSSTTPGTSTHVS